MSGVARIELAGLWRRFGERDALRDINLSIPAGEIHGLVGPNGAGKSTLLRVCAALVAPTHGLAQIDGVEAQPGMAQVGFVPAGTRSFYLRLTGLQNLVF